MDVTVPQLKDDLGSHFLALALQSCLSLSITRTELSCGDLMLNTSSHTKIRDILIHFLFLQCDGKFSIRILLWENIYFCGIFQWRGETRHD